MRHKPFFIECKKPPFPGRKCDRCELFILEVADGTMFWNPNGMALIRHLCRNCFETWRAEKVAKALAWRAKHAALESPYRDKNISNAALAGAPPPA